MNKRDFARTAVFIFAATTALSMVVCESASVERVAGRTNPPEAAPRDAGALDAQPARDAGGTVAAEDAGRPVGSSTFCGPVSASGPSLLATPLVGPGGDRARHIPYVDGTRVGLSEAVMLPRIATEEFALEKAEALTGYGIQALSENGPSGPAYYHPLPNIALRLSSDVDPSAVDHLLWTTATSSDVYPGRRPVIYRLPISRDRASVGPRDEVTRSGPGGGYTAYYGLGIVDACDPPRLFVAGEGEARARGEKVDVVENLDALIGAYDLGRTMTPAKEVYFGATPGDVSTVKSIVESAGQVVAAGPLRGILYLLGGMEAVPGGETPTQILPMVVELGSNAALPDFLLPVRSWVFGEDGFPWGTHTMMTANAVAEDGTLYFGGRTDAARPGVDPPPQEPYIVRIGTDGRITHRVFKFPDDQPMSTFAFGPMHVGAPRADGTRPLYWAFTAWESLIILKANASSLDIENIVAVNPEGLAGPFSRNFFVGSQLDGDRLVVTGSFSKRTDHAMASNARGFVVVRRAADLGHDSAFYFDSPVADHDINLPISIVVDPRNRRNLFIAGVAGRRTGTADAEEFMTYVMRIEAPRVGGTP